MRSTNLQLKGISSSELGCNGRAGSGKAGFLAAPRVLQVYLAGRRVGDGMDQE